MRQLHSQLRLPCVYTVIENALGATLWDLLTGRPPKRDRLDTTNFELERRRVLDVVAAALVDDPRQRPSAAALADSIIGAAA